MNTDTTLVHSLLDEVRSGGSTNPNDKPSLDELMHYGKKGMRWGQRMTSSQRTDAIRGAQANVQSQKRALGRQASVASNARGTKDEGRQQQKYANMEKAYLKNPDRATALRYTRGDKIAVGLIAGVLLGPGTVGAAVGTGATVATRKTIERRQRNGYYD